MFSLICMSKIKTGQFATSRFEAITQQSTFTLRFGRSADETILKDILHYFLVSGKIDKVSISGKVSMEQAISPSPYVRTSEVLMRLELSMKLPILATLVRD